MKSSWGGQRDGAGRKPKADELRIAEQMDAIGDTAKVFGALWKLVEGGSEPAIKLWLSYRLGQPKQTIEQNNTGDQTLTIVRSGHSYPPVIHTTPSPAADPIQS